MQPYGFDTLQLHAGQRPDGDTGARAVPIYQTTSYLYPSAQQAADVFAGKTPGYTYTRIENPTVRVLEERVAALEGGADAVAFASGMAAITAAVFTLCESGDHIVAISTLYGGTVTLLGSRLPRLANIRTTFVSPDDVDALERAIQGNTRMVYLETVCNPNINIPDFEAIARVAHSHGLPVVLDNTFGIPPLFSAARWGVDVVVHSLSKYAGGHGTTIGGMVVDMGRFDFLSDRFRAFREPDATNGGIVYAGRPAPVATRLRMQTVRDMGACLSPASAWLILQGLETLSLRVRKHNENALAVARFLQAHEAVEYVHYPSLPGDPYHERACKYMPGGAGAVMSFGVRGGLRAGQRFIDALRLFSLLANVADAKSLVIHPASTTHGQMNEQELRAAGVPPELIRLSVGLEDVGDLLADLEQALRASQTA